MTDLAARILARLDELEAMEQAATEGTWALVQVEPEVSVDAIERWFVMGRFPSGNPTGPAAICEYEPDAALIALLRNLAPGVVDGLRDFVGGIERRLERHLTCTDKYGSWCGWCQGPDPCPDAVAAQADLESIARMVEVEP